MKRWLRANILKKLASRQAGKPASDINTRNLSFDACYNYSETLRQNERQGLGLRGAIGAIALIALSGCASMAPEYARPEAPVPSEWPSGPSYKDNAAKSGDRSAADITWQEFFVDPKLQKLIALALENNRDLRIAALNIEKSQALYRI